MSSDDNKALRQDLQELRDRVFLMAGRVEVMLADAVRSLVEQDRELARATIAADRRINRAEKESDALCMRILRGHCALPASTLRFVTFSLKMVTDLERIGDLAVAISQLSVGLAAHRPLPVYSVIEELGRIVGDMVKGSIAAFIDHDDGKAGWVLERQSEAEAVHQQVFDRTVDMLIQDSSSAHRCIALQSIAKWLERAAAHATNLAEQVIFLTRGEDVRHQEDLDQTLSDYVPESEL